MEEEQQPATADERPSTAEYLAAPRTAKGEAKTGSEMHQGDPSTTHTDYKATRRRTRAEYANDKPASRRDRARGGTRSPPLR